MIYSLSIAYTEIKDNWPEETVQFVFFCCSGRFYVWAMRCKLSVTLPMQLLSDHSIQPSVL